MENFAALGAKSSLFNDASEVQRLKRENARLHKENEILKWAAVGSPHLSFAKVSL